MDDSESSFYCWKVHPIANNPFRALLTLIVVPACGVLAYKYTDSYFMSAVAVSLLCGSLINFFVPTTYKIDREKVEIKILYKTRIEPLSKFKKFITDDNGIFLSSEPESKVLDQFRGLFLLAGPDDREKIAKILKGVFEK